MRAEFLLLPRSAPALLLATALALSSCATPEFAAQRSALPGPLPPANATTLPTTGQVEFRGFTAQSLADFLVIPEEGTALFVPANGLHANVDGFWWRPSRQWFKIPNHCAVVLTAAPEPVRPSAFTETHDCGSLGSTLQKLRGLPDAPGFYEDSGSTGHGTDYPFGP